MFGDVVSDDPVICRNFADDVPDYVYIVILSQIPRMYNWLILQIDCISKKPRLWKSQPPVLSIDEIT